MKTRAKRCQRSSEKDCILDLMNLVWCRRSTEHWQTLRPTTLAITILQKATYNDCMMQFTRDWQYKRKSLRLLCGGRCWHQARAEHGSATLAHSPQFMDISKQHKPRSLARKQHTVFKKLTELRIIIIIVVELVKMLYWKSADKTPRSRSHLVQVAQLWQRDRASSIKDFRWGVNLMLL